MVRRGFLKKELFYLSGTGVLLRVVLDTTMRTVACFFNIIRDVVCKSRAMNEMTMAHIFAVVKNRSFLEERQCCGMC